METNFSGYCWFHEIGRAAVGMEILVGIPVGMRIEIRFPLLYGSAGNRRPESKRRTYASLVAIHGYATGDLCE